MANKQTILELKEYNIDTLVSGLLYLNFKNILSKPQLKTIELLCKPNLPANIELKQRSPKSVINVYINGVEKYQVNNRSKINYIYS